MTKLIDEERELVIKVLAEYNRRRRTNPLKYAKMHKKQKQATKSDKAIRALFWGNRVGKTEWGAMEVARYATGEHPYRELEPPFEIWCCCPSFDAQEHTTQKKLMSYLPPDEIMRTEKLRGSILRSITMSNGVKILFKSYEQGREKFQGAGVRLLWFDEEPPKDIWEECFVRVEAGQQLDVILTMTAIKGMTWVYDDIYMATDNQDLFVSEAGWNDNPWLTDKQKEQMSRGLSLDALKVRREGKFVKRVGLVCLWWQREKHLRHYETLDRGWTWYEILDGGWSDPAAWLLLGVDGDNNVHVVDGFRRKQLTSEHIKEIRDAKISGLTITCGWIDNEDPRLQDALGELGMNLAAIEKKAGESKSWDETLAEKLAEYGQVQAGTGEPRLYVSDNLVEINETTGNSENWLMQEIENLVWLEKKGRDGEEVKPKWDDHRRFGHHFDGVRALAYFLMSYMKPADDNEQVAYYDDSLFDNYGGY